MPDEQDQEQHDIEMSLGEHLEQLRWRIIYALAGVMVVVIAMFFVGTDLVAWLCQPLFDALAAHGLEQKVETFSPTEAFGVYVKVSTVVGLIVALPWVVYQFWKFVSVGLYASERRAALVLAPFSALMALLGTAFLYYIMLPICLNFFVGFAESYPVVEGNRPSWVMRLMHPQTPEETETVQPPMVLPQIPVLSKNPSNPNEGEMWIRGDELHVRTADKTLVFPPANRPHSMMRLSVRLVDYISFVTTLLLASVVSFQVPVVLMIVGWTGLVEPAWFSKYRPHFIVVCFFLGMILSPGADVVTMIVLSLPLCALFELGILLMRLTYSRQQKNH